MRAWCLLGGLSLSLGVAPACKTTENNRTSAGTPVRRPSPPEPRANSTDGLTFPVEPASPTPLRAVREFAKLSFRKPVLLTHAPGEPGKVFVVEQRGTVVVFDNDPGAQETHSFADLTDRVRMRHNEEGLLGMAFDPQYERNGWVYVYYSASRPRRTQLSRFTARDGQLDPDTEVVLLAVEQPYGNHNGGMVAFGPKGGLYVGVGDGGWAGDPELAGQDLGQWLGKILRIEPTDAGGYKVPADNPFVGQAGAKPEIWAYGLRNPWRFSFDRQQGSLWVGDVGQNAREEVDIVTRGGNYGWNAREGTSTYASTAPNGPMVDPVIEYGHSEGQSITGGYVYRGTRLANYRGAYFYGDYVSGTIWALVHDGDAVVSNQIVATVPELSSFGEDAQGELYAVSLRGAIYRFDPSGDGDPAGFPTRLSQTGVFTDTARCTPNPHLLAYEVRQPLWSDGAAKQRWLGVPKGKKVGFDAENGWTFPVGTVAVKHFELNGTRLETRVMVHEQFGWSGYTYRWNEAQTDADLLTSAQSMDVSGQRWDFPSSSDCNRCHTPGYGELLGVRTRQIPRATLADWNARGLFDRDIGDPNALPMHPGPSGAPTEVARAYLDVNCAPCHHPGGPAPVPVDMRVGTPLADTGLLAEAEDKTGSTAESRIAAGDHAHSAIWARMTRRGDKAMPPLASTVVDSAGARLVAQWIDALPAPPR